MEDLGGIALFGYDWANDQAQVTPCEVIEMDTEFKGPALMLGTGLAIFAVAAFLIAGAEGVGWVMLGIGVQIVIGVVSGVLALYLMAMIFSMAFGNLHTALLKLAAAIIFPASIGMLFASFMPVPCVGHLVVLAIYISMLMWMFDLELVEAAMCGIVLGVVQFLAAIAATAVIEGILESV